MSTGSLQHHFPTQRVLMDAVMTMLYDLALPEGRLDDPTIPPKDRIVGCLQQLLAPSPDTPPRDAWIQVFERYILPEPTARVIEEYLAIERGARRRVEHCLSILQEEGALVPGDLARRARFLMSVVTGLSVAQSLPSEPSRLVSELESLHAAADWVLADGRAATEVDP